MKKVISLALAALLCFSLSLSAFADDFVDKPVISSPVYNGDYSKYYDRSLNFNLKNSEDLNLYQYLEKYSVSYPVTDIDTAAVAVSDLMRRISSEFAFRSHSMVVKELPLSGLFTVDYDVNATYHSCGATADLFCKFCPVQVGGSFLGYRYQGIYYFLLEDNDIFIVTSDCTGGFISSGYFFLPSSHFKQDIEEAKEDIVYYPLGSVSKVSWKTDKNFSNSSFDSDRTARYFTILEKYNFFGIDGLKEFYAVPFFEYGDELYFSNYCIYFNLGIQQINSSGEISLHTFDIGYVDTLNTAADLTNPEAYKALFDETKYSLAEESYIVNRINSNLYSAWYYSGFGNSIALQKREDFFSNPGLTNAGGGCAFFKGFYPFKKLYNSKNSTLSVSDSVFNSYFTKGSLSEKAEDYGFYISETPIIMDCFGSDIDTSKIPDTYYITVSGDTIYDYSITNPDTGQSSTINEYITNNYTYITNNNPSGDGSGSGTTGGNVTVGGNVGVNGSVNVGGEVKFGGEVNVGVDVSPIDINVNVSGNGGAGESGGEPPEIGGLDDLVGYLPEKSPVISQYLKIFFDTLPPELLALILAGVAVAVIKLIFRR